MHITNSLIWKYRAGLALLVYEKHYIFAGLLMAKKFYDFNAWQHHPFMLPDYTIPRRSIGIIRYYTITILHQLLIYTSMKHSLLLTQTFRACISLFGHPVWHYNKSIYTYLLIKMLSITIPCQACLVLCLSIVNNFY